MSRGSLAKRFGVSPGVVGDIVFRRKWKWLGDDWRDLVNFNLKETANG
jgi:hypothetical protein